MRADSIIIVGGGGHARACIDVIEREGAWTIAGIIDSADKRGQKVLGYDIIGSDEDLPALAGSFKNALVTVGQIRTPDVRQGIYAQLKALGFALPVIISPIAYVSCHAAIGEGTIVMHHALVNAQARIGRNCIINTKALVEHDAIVDDHCHISTAAVVNGGAHIGAGTFFGSNAVSREGAESGERAFIKAGQVLK